MHATHTKIILGAHKGKDGKYPVQLRVTYVYARPINIKHKGMIKVEDMLHVHANNPK